MNCRNLHILLSLMLTHGAVEFKSVKDVPPANFLEQFGKDLKNTDVSDLSQIKWIFDGKKVTQDELTETMRNTIEEWNVPKDLVRKFRPIDEDVAIFKTDIISIFTAK